MAVYIINNNLELINPLTGEPMPEKIVTYWNGSEWVEATVSEWFKFRKENNLGIYVETKYNKLEGDWL